MPAQLGPGTVYGRGCRGQGARVSSHHSNYRAVMSAPAQRISIIACFCRSNRFVVNCAVRIKLSLIALQWKGHENELTTHHGHTNPRCPFCRGVGRGPLGHAPLAISKYAAAILPTSFCLYRSLKVWKGSVNRPS